MAIPRATTVDGFEMQFGTNHLGHFALTNLLLPHITDRVMTVSSGEHRRGTMRFDDLNWAPATSRGPRTGSRSWPTCCSSWNCSAG